MNGGDGIRRYKELQTDETKLTGSHRHMSLPASSIYPASKQSSFRPTLAIMEHTHWPLIFYNHTHILLPTSSTRPGRKPSNSASTLAIIS